MTRTGGLFVFCALPLQACEAVFELGYLALSVRGDSFEGAGSVVMCGIYFVGAVFIVFGELDVG